MITPALIVPRGTQFLVFGGEDLIATCPTLKEADFWVEIYGNFMEEFQRVIKNTFYKHNDSDCRMVPMFKEEDLIDTSGSTEVWWRCRVISNTGNVTYPVFTETDIKENFTAITFPKA